MPIGKKGFTLFFISVPHYNSEIIRATNGLIINKHSKIVSVTEF